MSYLGNGASGLGNGAREQGSKGAREQGSKGAREQVKLAGVAALLN